MSSYAPLASHLAARRGSDWTVSFDDIERILGRPLPPSAYRHSAWWANQEGPGHSQTRGWREAGWRTTALDLARRKVTFERAAARTNGSNADGEIERLIKQARAVGDVTDRHEILARALHGYIQHEATEGLIALGGTMPDLTVPERERPNW